MATDAKPASRSGQALVELALGLFAIVLLFSGFFAMAKIMTGSLDLHGKLRAESGCRALAAAAGSPPEGGGRWNEGPDGLQYTPDDFREGTVLLSVQALAEKSASSPRDWEYPARHSALPFSMIPFATGEPAFPASFLEASGETKAKVDPFAAKYLFGPDEVRKKLKVRMPAMEGLL